MVIYPAIDIIGGQCVRLSQGSYDAVTVYDKNPLNVAKKWCACGAQFIHLVDLDGAKTGKTDNFGVVSSIAAGVTVPVQIGGGIRTEETIQKYLSAGVQRVILGTKAVQDREFLKQMLLKYREKIVVGIDAKDGKVAIEGWEKVSSLNAVDFAKEVCALGCATVIYTDIATDGMLQGPNIAAMREMSAAVSCDVIASGGISCIEDIAALLPSGVSGAITGKALYTGKLNLEEAIRIAGGTADAD